jgi:hypothetical protein
MKQTLWNFEPAIGIDCMGTFRLEYPRPMHWKVWQSHVGCPNSYECKVNGDLDELNSWAIGMHQDGRHDVLESIGIQLLLDPVKQFFGIRPNARLIAIARPFHIRQETIRGPDESQPQLYVFAEPSRGHSLAIWSLLRSEHDQDIGDCEILSSGANSIEQVINLLLGINGDVTTLQGNTIEQLFTDMKHEHANFVRALAI